MSAPVFCPVCGHKLTRREEGGRVRPACDNCGYVHYVNPVPAVGILIEMDGGVVLIRRHNPPHRGRWTLPSGFIEADESAEEAAIREAKEETGLDVEIIELADVNSFPEGPPVSGIMVFYRTRPVGGKLRAGDDAAEARVFQPGELPVLPFRTHREMIARWLEQRENPRARASRLVDDEDFVIRPAEPKDIKEVIALLELIPANRQRTIDDWRETILRLRESSALEMIVAQSTQQPPLIIGCIALSIIRAATEGHGFINDMAVLPAYQRRGVGAALLEAVMRRAHQLNLREIMVNTDRGNDSARAFYAALGFAGRQLMCLKLR